MLLGLVILTILACISSAERSIFTKSYHFPVSKDISYGSGHDMTKLIYTTYNVSRSNSIKRCVVTTISGAFDKSTTGVTRQCEVSLRREVPNGIIMNYCKAHEFDSDKVIVLWMEAQNVTVSRKQIQSVIVKTSVVDMTRNCHTAETTVREYLVRDMNSISINCIRPKIIVFNDSYEIAVAQTINRKCDDTPICDYVLYKYDAEGYQISGPQHWPISDQIGSCPLWFTIKSVKLHTNNTGYFINSPDRMVVSSKLITGRSNGHEKLQTLNVEFDDSLEGYGYSSANDVQGLCYFYKNSSFGCWQTDERELFHKKTQLQLEHPFKLFINHVHNLRKGGLLMSIYICSDTICYRRDEYLMKIDRQGVTKAVKVELEFVRPDKFYFESRIFENNLGQYCKTVIITPVTSEKLVGTVNAYINCYSPDEFTEHLKEFGL